MESAGASGAPVSSAGLIDILREIEAAKPHARLVGSRTWAGASGRDVIGIETVLIVDLAFFGIAQDIVGLLNLLEAILGGLVTRIEVGMVFASQLAI